MTGRSSSRAATTLSDRPAMSAGSTMSSAATIAPTTGAVGTVATRTR